MYNPLHRNSSCLIRVSELNIRKRLTYPRAVKRVYLSFWRKITHDLAYLNFIQTEMGPWDSGTRDNPDSYLEGAWFERGPGHRLS